MTKCRYCGSSTEYVTSVKAGVTKTFDVRECPDCGLSSLYPFPETALIREALNIHQERFQSFDPAFEWKLFFARRYFDDGYRVLIIGLEDISLSDAFKKEQIDIVQINTASPNALSKFSNNEFDAVFIWDMLGFVENIRGFLNEIHRITEKDGYVSIRARDAFSRINQSRGIENFIMGDPNFLGIKFLRRIYRDYFNEVPRCFMQEAYKDSIIVTLGKSNSGDPRNYSMNVLLMVHHYLFSKLDDATGPRGRVLNTIDMLDRYNVKADISLSLMPSAAGYDIVHLFHNAWETQDALSQMISAKQDHTKVIISTIYMDPSETNFVINTINRIFKITNQDERDAFLNMLAQGKLRAGNLSQGMRFYARWNIEEDQKALLEMADRLICFSYTEMRQMSLNLNRIRPFSIVYNSADHETFGVHSPEVFIESYGIKDFVIAAGHVEWRKNQLMMLYALRNNPEIPIVIVGAKTNDEYYELCRLWAHKNTTFISQLKHRHLASAFAAAKVHAQPSWIEGISLSAIEAAMCGCTPVVADRAGEIEYYGELGAYANPGSIDSIRKAVLAAYRNNNLKLRQKTAEYVKARYTFKNAVELTIEAYKKTLNSEETPPPLHPLPQGEGRLLPSICDGATR